MASSGEPQEIDLYVAEPLLAFLRNQATRLDRNLGYVTQLAFAHARETIERSDHAALDSAVRRYAGADKYLQKMFLPAEMIDAMRQQASRLDSSLSFVAQCAVALARDAIAALPADS